jgi:hypothetical protein
LLPNILMHRWQLNMLFFLAKDNGMFRLITLLALHYYFHIQSWKYKNPFLKGRSDIPLRSIVFPLHNFYF